MTDELLYVKLALQIGDSLSLIPAVRGEHYEQFTPLYPLLIAPLFEAFDTPVAFRLAHLLNAALMASTVVPVYLLSRELSLTRLGGYVAALLTVAVPWIVFANQIATESLAYPLFAWAVLAIVRATAEPSAKGDLLAIGAIALATLARTQFAVLAGVLIVAIVVHELVFARLRASGSSFARADLTAVLRRLPAAHPVVAGSVVVAIVALAALALTGGVGRLVGNYEGLAEGELLPHGISRSIRAHMALLAASVFVVPFVLAVAFGVGAFLRPASKAEHAFAVVLAFTVVAIVFVTAHVNVRTGGLIQERYAFYVVPPVMVAMAAFLVRPRLTVVGLLAGGSLIAWMLGTLDYAIENSYSFASPFHLVVDDRSGDVGRALGIDDLDARELTVFLTIIAVPLLFAVLRLARPNWALVGVGGVVLVSCAVETAYDFEKLFPSQDSSKARLGLDSPGARERGLNWVDDVLPGDARAAFMPGLVGRLEVTRKAWWDLEFWNKSVDRMYAYEPAWRDTPFPEQQLSIDWSSGALQVRDSRSHVVLPRYDRRLGVAGRTLATTSLLELIEARQPLHASWAVRGTDQDGWTTAGKAAVVRVYPDSSQAGRRAIASIRLTSTADVASRRSFRVAGGERVVRAAIPPRRSQRVRVAFCMPASRPTDLVMRVRGRSVLPGGRRVGLAVTGVRLGLAGGGCARQG